MKTESKLSTTMSTLIQFFSKKMLIATLFVVVSNRISAQDCNPYYPLNEGKVYELKSYDHKDKLQSSTTQQVLNIKSSGSTTTAQINYSGADKKGKETVSGTYDVKCSNGNFEVDMSSMLTSVDQLQNFNDMDMKVEGDFLDLPSNPTKGQKLKDGKITASVSNMGMDLFKMTVVISERKVEDFVSITTPAGTFECVKISYISRAKIAFKIIETKVVEYYSKEVGLVKTENYKLKDNSLEGYTQLESIK